MDTMEGLLTWPVFGIIVLSILVGSIRGPCWV
jgi:energy-coupling factor transport system substrate-specific component